MTHQVTIMPAVKLKLGRDSKPMPQPHALSIATPPTNGTAVISRKPNKGTTILPAPVRCGTHDDAIPSPKNAPTTAPRRAARDWAGSGCHPSIQQYVTIIFAMGPNNRSTYENSS